MDRGFTLIEMIMVIAILGVIGTTILLYFVGVGKAPYQVRIAQATTLAEEKIEELLVERKVTGFDSLVSEPPAALPTPFDDFIREVEVFCVQEADLETSNGTMPACLDSDIRGKRVAVRVAWPGGDTEYVTVIQAVDLCQ